MGNNKKTENNSKEISYCICAYSANLSGSAIRSLSICSDAVVSNLSKQADQEIVKSVSVLASAEKEQISAS